MTFDHSSALFLTGVAALCVVACFHLWISRRDQFFFFGRTVPEGFQTTAEARAIVSLYRRQTLANLLLAVVFLVFLTIYRAPLHLSVSGVPMLALIIQGILFNFAFARANHASASALEDQHEAAGSHIIAVPLLLNPAAAPPRLSTILLPGVAAI